MNSWIVKAALSGAIGGYVGAYVSRRITASWIREDDGPEKKAAISSAIQTVAIAGTFMLLGWSDADPSIAPTAAPAIAA